MRARNAAGVFGPFSSTRRFTPAAATGASSLSTLGVSPTSVVGGASSTGTVTLTAAAPTGGATVALASSNPAVTVPASVSVAAGATSATFSATTTSVASATAVTLTATFGGVSRTTTLTVNPPASLTGVALAPASVVGGASSTGTVTLSQRRADRRTGRGPDQLEHCGLRAGQRHRCRRCDNGDVHDRHHPVTAPRAITITAVAGGVTRTATLTVNPAATGALPAPTLLSPSNDARFNPGQTIVFDWSDVAGAASYTIQIDDQENFSSPTINQTVSASTYSTSTLPTTRMWWRARAVDAAGAPGAWSSARRFEVKS